MSRSQQLMQKIEQSLLNEFRQVPFHNLYYLGYSSAAEDRLGGTCSDKVVFFKKKLAIKGIKSSLHSAFIQGKETHRLLVIDIEGVNYFADVGNGWPSIKLFPASSEITYTAFGITFTSSLRDGFLDVHQVKGTDEYLSLVIPLQLKDEHLILNDIEKRFDGHIDYPFSNGLRFSQVIGDDFIFLKNDRLRIFNARNPERTIQLTNTLAAFTAIEHYFLVDLNQFGIDLEEFSRISLEDSSEQY